MLVQSFKGRTLMTKRQATKNVVRDVNRTNCRLCNNDGHSFGIGETDLVAVKEVVHLYSFYRAS